MVVEYTVCYLKFKCFNLHPGGKVGAGIVGWVSPATMHVGLEQKCAVCSQIEESPPHLDVSRIQNSLFILCLNHTRLGKIICTVQYCAESFIGGKVYANNHQKFTGLWSALIPELMTGYCKI